MCSLSRQLQSCSYLKAQGWRDRVHLVACGHLWPRESHHGIRHSRKPQVERKLHGSSVFYKTRVIADRSFTLREYGFSTFLFLWPWPCPMTFIYELDPVLSRDARDVWKWTCYVKTFESYSYRLDIQTDIGRWNYTTPLRADGRKTNSKRWQLPLQCHFRPPSH